MNLLDGNNNLTDSFDILFDEQHLRYDPFEMNAATAQALGEALGVALAANRETASRKPTLFSTGEPADWIIWRRQFEMIAALRNWNDQRKCRELFTAMTDKAAKAVGDINVEPAGAGPHYDNVIAQYEARFVSAANSELARVHFQGAKQTDDESLLQWHSRCRELFTRAYPGVAFDGEAGRLLRERFTIGLSNTDIKAYVWDQRAQTYQGVLEAAQNKLSTQQMLVLGDPTKADEVDELTEGLAKASINALSGGGKKGKAPVTQDLREPEWIAAMEPHTGCWICGDKRHMRAECPAANKMVEYCRSIGMGPAAEELQQHFKVVRSRRPRLPSRGGRGRFRGSGARGGWKPPGTAAAPGGQAQKKEWLGALDSSKEGGPSAEEEHADAEEDEGSTGNTLAPLAPDVDDDDYDAAWVDAGYTYGEGN